MRNLTINSSGGIRPNTLLAQIQLLLAATVLVRCITPLDEATVSRDNDLFAPAFAAYSLTVFMMCRRGMTARTRSIVVLGEIAWLSVFVATSGGAASPFFPFYILSIMIAAFSAGKSDGLPATFAATALFCVAAMSHFGPGDVPRLIVRCGFLLTFGILSSYLGESNLLQQRRLALLRDVVGFANPRFGTDRTIADIMEQSRAHFDADVCLLVAGRWRSRLRQLRTTSGSPPQTLPLDHPFCRIDVDGVLLYNRRWPAWLDRPGRLQRLDGDGKWRCANADGEATANLCGSRSFISVPVNFRSTTARVFISAGRRQFDTNDAIFLELIVSQVVPAIENVYLLDRLGSLAALRERRTMGHDLHDSAVQPYIGLNARLSALRRKAGADNPLRSDIEDLANMSAQVIADLRHFAAGFQRGGNGGAKGLLDAPLRRQLLRARQWYGVEIDLELQGSAAIGDRLSVALLQLTQEGISNICKHTKARRAMVSIDCDKTGVRVEIINDSAQPVSAFTPRSILRRALALGGTIAVFHRAGATVVQVDIPA